MLLNNRAEEFNYHVIVQVDDFATSVKVKCFGCGVEEHLVRVLTRRSWLAASAAVVAGATPGGKPVPAPHLSNSSATGETAGFSRAGGVKEQQQVKNNNCGEVEEMGERKLGATGELGKQDGEKRVVEKSGKVMGTTEVRGADEVEETGEVWETGERR